MGLLCLAVDIHVVLRWGTYPAYLAETALTAVIVIVQPLRHLRVRVSFLLTYAALAGMAALIWLSPVNLGLSPILVMAPTSLYAVTRWAPDQRWGVGGLLLALCGSVLNPVLLRALRSQTDLVTGGGPLLFSTTCALVVTWAHLAASSARRRAEEQDRAVEAAAQQAAAKAAATERVTIARELHDLVGHTLTVVKVQASTGLTLGGHEQMRQALAAIREASSASLESVRDYVSLLRDPSAGTQATPPADLGALSQMVDRARTAGLRIEARLPADEELRAWNETWTAVERLTLSRVLAEGLTNAVRHGGGQARLSVTATPDRCALELSNTLGDGDTHIPVRHGAGLAGLTERLRLASGILEAGTEWVDGEERFVLRAVFPVRGTGAPPMTAATAAPAQTLGPDGGRRP
ncbi:MAG: histidine kinase [Actinomyces sp.]|uniref:sensor histidine kinase n=1 Tax=Actinomyces sp. TaxID=29317 RepID=UPI0026DC76D3|nr:histidine kinase [Actinomyces sp.]MDO4243143.1 histidine kinase [Actinomyces sp.]